MNEEPATHEDDSPESRAGNRLRFEKSPYLLQHAHNPVDWYPWGEEAFETARREDKPVFLSIGYSTCHWCHVMERESFEDREIARRMNEAFVSIKVDREERPDIDNIYMTVCQMMTGSGGWPLTIVMTPEKRPFFAGTYFPRESRMGRVGMLELVPRLGELWRDRREDIEQSAGQMQAVLERTFRTSGGDALDEAVLDLASRQLERRYDPAYGGFGTAPKFPTPHNLMFLLRQWRRTGDEQLLPMIEKTLLAMRRGGIHDHVGFGFHRYSTDARWLVPHFEKMLYDQALLAMAYTEAYQASGQPLWRQTAEAIFTYVLRDMTAPEGGFYSAEDADSEGVEGKFYVCSWDEIHAVLDAEEARLVVRAFNVERSGNFREEATREKTGTNILHMTESLEELAARLALPEETLRERLESARCKLFDAREQRVHPGKDDKVLTDWNGLMIVALAKAAQAFDAPQYAAAAGRAADFILSTLRLNDGGLRHRWRQGEAAIHGYVDDYAFLIWGLLELYEATFEIGRLRAALDLNDYLIRHFWDEQGGGFFFSSDAAESLLIRQKEIYDGAVPSGNSVAMLNLLRLGLITEDRTLEEKAVRIGQAFAEELRQAPSAYAQLLQAVDFAVGPVHEIVIVGAPSNEDTQAMLRAVRQRFVPRKVLLLRPAGEREPEIGRVAPFTKDLTPLDGHATAFVCMNYGCNLPTTDVGEMLNLLNV